MSYLDTFCLWIGRVTLVAAVCCLLIFISAILRTTCRDIKRIAEYPQDGTIRWYHWPVIFCIRVWAQTKAHLGGYYIGICQYQKED